MEYRILGKTGLKISRMGFGGIPIQKIDAEGTKALMKRSTPKAAEESPWPVRTDGGQRGNITSEPDGRTYSKPPRMPR